MRACWLLTTLGPSWNVTGPAAGDGEVEVFTIGQLRVDEEKLSCKVDVLIEACKPLPVACTPFTRAATSVPVARVEELLVLSRVANVPLRALA